MSLLIKGMEMPTEDEEIIIRISSDGTVMTQYALPITGIKAVPVPPHGDLIGRDWLIDIALHLMNTAKNDDIANGVKWLWQYIIDAPTIIPAEEGE